MTEIHHLAVWPLDDATPIPPQLRASLERHQANLARLAAGLRQAGMDDAMIEASVGTLVESYRRELLQAMKALAAAPAATEGM